MQNIETRKQIPVNQLQPGDYFSVAEFPDVPLKCREHDEHGKRIIAICCDPWYHKLAVSYDDSVLLGFPD